MTKVPLQFAVEDHTLITGGHFTLTEDGSSLNEGTIHSFKQAATLYAQEKERSKGLGFGILINDIGAVCSASGCQTQVVPKKDHFEFPPPYLSVLKELSISLEEIEIFWEKHIRNRAKKQLHSQISKGNPCILYLENEGYVYRSEDGGFEAILTRYSKNDKRGTPACPLIMSAYSLEHQRRGYQSSLNFYYVAEDNYINVANYFVIEKGCFLATCFDPNVGLTRNVYLFKDKHLKNF